MEKDSSPWRGGRMPELWTVTSCPVAVHTEWSHCPALFSLFFLPSQIQQTYVTKLHCSITGIHYPGRTVAQPYKNLMDRVQYPSLRCPTLHLDIPRWKRLGLRRNKIDGDGQVCNWWMPGQKRRWGTNSRGRCVTYRPFETMPKIASGTIINQFNTKTWPTYILYVTWS